MKVDFVALVGIPVIALVGLLLAWLYGRAITRGQPLTPVMRKFLLYGFIFGLGTGYSAVIDAMFGSRTPWVVFPTVWAILLSVVAWLRSRKKDTALDVPREPISKQLAEGLPVVGTIVCLSGAAIDWDLIYEGQGRWPFGLLWIAGVAAMVLLARHSRRTTVVVSLRAFAVLLAIGAIAQKSLPAFVAAVVVACVLLSLEKLWPNRNAGGAQHIQQF